MMDTTPAQNALAWELLGYLVKYKTDPCRFDHDGDCQEHGYFNCEFLCPVGEARKLLAKVELL
jgi:hypothetical protein